MHIRARHNRHLFDLKKQKKIVTQAVKLLKPFVGQFDYLAISGFSGALVAPIVADKLKKQIVLVRKGGDSSHSANLNVEGPTEGRYIIFDDFIATGHTVNYIKNMITSIPEINLEYIGFYMYLGLHGHRKEALESDFGGKMFGDVDADYW